MNKILFITHNTSRTGAPLVLLYFMRWLKVNQPNYQIDCLTLGGGDLNAEFTEVSDQFYNVVPTSKQNMLYFKIFYKALGTSVKKNHHKRIIKDIKNQKYDVIYANTVASLDWGARIKDEIPGIKLVLHIHELEFVIKTMSPNFSKLKNKVDTWICASKLVMKNIIDKHAIPIENVKTIYAFSKVNFDDEIRVSKDDQSFIVGGSGLVTRRKGYDLFIAVAKEVKRQAPDLDILFNWIGKIPKKGVEIEIQSDIDKSHLTGIVNFKGEEANPFRSFNSFDLFLMTSREDPFPLVCIEVGSMGKPILCFEGATGTEEMLSDGGGKIAPYLSVFDMAKHIIEYATNADLLKLHGLQAKEKFAPFNVETQAPKIHNVLNAMLHDG